jgi:hypothetical protein
MPLCLAQGHCIHVQLAFFDCTQRASASAGTAGNAFVSIDDVTVFTFGNDAQGASISASAALHAAVIDNICHDFAPPCF